MKELYDTRLAYSCRELDAGCDLIVEWTNDGRITAGEVGEALWLADVRPGRPFARKMIDALVEGAYDDFVAREGLTPGTPALGVFREVMAARRRSVRGRGRPLRSGDVEGLVEIAQRAEPGRSA